tara:strand:- start:948 stop:1148 length:201 start_codon:yes stop_codon:yes gene_type:complete
MNQIEVGDLVTHRMSKVQLFNFDIPRRPSSLPGIVLEINHDKLLILWETYTEWVDLAYLLKISRVK